MISTDTVQELRQQYDREMEAIRMRFVSSHDGLSCIGDRAALVDRVVVALAVKHLPAAISVVALGGYGRSTLFPYSDVDLLFLCADEAAEAEAKAPIAEMTREIWDVGMRVSPFTRTLAECAKPQA